MSKVTADEAKVTIGCCVKVRGCPGLGIGKIIRVDTTMGGVPYVGHVRVYVDFGPNYPDGRHIESFSNRELHIVKGA